MSYQAFRPGSPKRNTYAEAFQDAFNSATAEQNAAKVYARYKAEGYWHEDAKDLTAIELGTEEYDYVCDAIEQDRINRFNTCTIVEYSAGDDEPKIVNKS